MKSQLTSLQQQLDAKYGQIFDLIAAQLGFPDISKMSAAERAQLDEETNDAIEQWEEAEMEDVEPAAISPLQVLFRERHEIAEQILNIRDDAVARSLRK